MNVVRTGPQTSVDSRDISLTTLDRMLQSDRFGTVRTIVTTSSNVSAVRAIAERCWHDAEVVIEEISFLSSRAA